MAFRSELDRVETEGRPTLGASWDRLGTEVMRVEFEPSARIAR